MIKQSDRIKWLIEWGANYFNQSGKVYLRKYVWDENWMVKRNQPYVLIGIDILSGAEYCRQREE